MKIPPSPPIRFPFFFSPFATETQEQWWYSVILIKTVSFIALCRFTVVGWKRSFHDNPPPRIYRSAKNNRDGETLENGYGRPTRIKLCVRRHICLLSRGDKMAGLFISRSWPFATINDRLIRMITIRRYVLFIIDLELQ